MRRGRWSGIVDSVQHLSVQSRRSGLRLSNISDFIVQPVTAELNYSRMCFLVVRRTTCLKFSRVCRFVPDSTTTFKRLLEMFLFTVAFFPHSLAASILTFARHFWSFFVESAPTSLLLTILTTLTLIRYLSLTLYTGRPS